MNRERKFADKMAAQIAKSLIICKKCLNLQVICAKKKEERESNKE